MPKSANETVRGTNPSKILELQKIRCTGWRTGTACTIGTAGFRTDRRQKRPRLPLSRKLFPIYQLIKINSANKAEHGTIAVKSLECFEFCCSVWCSCSASPSGTKSNRAGQKRIQRHALRQYLGSEEERQFPFAPGSHCCLRAAEPLARSV